MWIMLDEAGLTLSGLKGDEQPHNEPNCPCGNLLKAGAASDRFRVDW